MSHISAPFDAERRAEGLFGRLVLAGQHDDEDWDAIIFQVVLSSHSVWQHDVY